MRTFLELDEARLRDAVVIIDVDGTITHDKHERVEREIEDKIRRIASAAHVYLSSNGDIARTERFAAQLGVGYVDTHHKKPSRRVLESIAHDGVRRVVIGDKALTDGLLAINTGAEYIPVKRIRHSDDTIATRVVYALDDIAELIVRRAFPALPYIVLLRPLQWIKNTLVFTPVFFAGLVLDGSSMAAAAIAAGIFCAVSSSMYILNDIADRDHDASHPTKRGRPIASGAVPVGRAYALFALLAAAAGAGLYAMPALIPALGAYVALNVAYSYWLKHIAVVDVMLVSLFYVLRVIAGGAAAAVYVSPWIVLVVFFGALFLTVGKRRAEHGRASKRSVLNSYSRAALDHMLAGAATLTVTAYGLYSILGGHSPYTVYSTFFVFGAVFRLYNRMQNDDGSAEYPETLMFKDRWVFALMCAWAVFMLILLYV